MMNRKEVEESYSGEGALLFMDGYDHCIIGLCSRFGQDDIVAYDYGKVISANMTMGMTRDEAVEFFEYNQIGAWVGDNTPCFIHTS